MALWRHERAVRVRTTIAKELPDRPDFLDQVEIEVGNDDSVLIARGFRDDAPARIAEVAGAVELADVPRRFRADAVDRADEVAVGDGVRGLFELPQILGQAGHGRRRVENDLRPIQSKRTRAFRKVTVVADVDT